MVGSLNDWQKERQFQVLNAKKEDRAVKVRFHDTLHLQTWCKPRLIGIVCIDVHMFF